MKILASTVVIFLVLCPTTISTVQAQTSSDSPRNNNNNNIDNNDRNNQYPYARFSPSMAVIIVVLIAALFFMGFFSIYIRHCSDSSSSGGTGGSIRRALSMRARRAAAARGLDASVIGSFPTFTYAEVRDHQIGKGVLECAVCLNEFQDEETLRLLPKCDHVFHPQCIDAWLESHVTCPVCRANLVPQEGEDEPVQQVVAESTAEEAVNENNGQSLNRTVSIQQNDQFVVIQINDDNNNNNQSQSQGNNDNNTSIECRNRSLRRPRMFGFGKFRSHSTGHDSLVQPGENLNRFTLRLPAEVRKEVINRSALNRAKSFGTTTTTLPRESSSRRGYRTGGEAGSRTGRFYRRMDRSDGAARSDRWVFFTRAFSMRSPRVVAEMGDSSGAGSGTVTGMGSKRSGSIGRALVKMPSFKCLEPSVNNGDEISLVSKEPDRSDRV